MKYSTVNKVSELNKGFRNLIDKLPTGSLTTVLAVVVFGVAGSYLLVASRGATPTASLETESGTVSSAASKVTDATASSGQAVKLGSASSGSNAKPDATNTGVPVGTNLTVVNGNVTVTTNGTVIDGQDIKGFLLIRASNVTVKNSLIEGGVATGNGAGIDIQSGTGTLIDHVTVALAHPSAYLDSIWGDNVTIQYSNISLGVDGMKIGSGATVKNSWIHDLSQFAHDPNQNNGPTHNDTIQILGGSNILIQNNNLQAIASDNSAIQITQDFGPVSNVTMQSNWADGGGCTFNISYNGGISLSNIFVYNNRFGRNSFYDCPILIGTKVTLTQSGNVYDDNNQAVQIQQHD